MPIELICLDADDTLWHNEKHFGATFAAFEQIVAPFDEAGVARETLDAIQIRNLKLYGYGAKSFTLSMIEAALEVGGERMPGDAVARILAAGRELLAHPVELLPGIEDALDALADRARLVLVTKGDLLHQETKLAASGLGDRFSGIEIVSDKDEATFRRVFDRHAVTPGIRCGPTSCPRSRPAPSRPTSRTRRRGRTKWRRNRPTTPVSASSAGWARSSTGSTASDRFG